MKDVYLNGKRVDSCEIDPENHLNIGLFMPPCVDIEFMKLRDLMKAEIYDKYKIPPGKIGREVGGRRVGKFYVSFALVTRNDTRIICNKIIDQLKFIPVRVEALYPGSVFEYVGISEMFREISLGEKIPTYNISITKHDDGEIFVNAVEICQK